MFTQNHLRQATEEEQSFYEDRLYPLQDNVLSLLQTDRFYLSGGTALSRWHYDHRYSDDLDLFFRGDAFPREEFSVIYREVAARLAGDFQIEAAIDGEYFKRIFITHKDVSLKVEFIYENYPHCGEYLKSNDCLIDSSENIAVNKITAVQDRKTAKDFVDLYFLLNDFELGLLMTDAAKKIVPLDYEGTVMAFADTAPEGIALLKRPMTADELNQFSRSLIKRLINNARNSQ
ncbi:MAG: nucleotidyl transferase AbiEii/AbiGii toxin family protein [Deltaproteobacteria bacterium]|nr:nucleotidyl transferase AbiEii/AbiGii toxin family protein [Deltaproteobacteria bacterium]